jgi:hypothetical protein
MNVAYVHHYDSDPLATGTHKGPDDMAFLFDPSAKFSLLGVDTGLVIYKTAINPDEIGYLETEGEERVVTEDGDEIVISTASEDEMGHITEVTEDSVYADTITSWKTGDIYNIYKTATRDSFISRIATDRSRGWKVSKPDEVNEYGWFPEDADIDKDESGRKLPKHERPFGPGQPIRRR